MTTLSRWKLACALFAAVAGVATVRAHKGGRDVPAQVAQGPREALPMIILKAWCKLKRMLSSKNSKIING